MITLYTLSHIPAYAAGQVRELRVRWALEEAGLRYRTHLLTPSDQDTPQYRALQPFGQVPVFEEDGKFLFESGAINLHIGERSPTLLPLDPDARLRAIQWVFAAINTLEPPIMNAALLDSRFAGQEWAKLRRDGAREIAMRRIDELGRALGDRSYLDGDTFTLGDLMMACVLKTSDDLVESPVVQRYVERCIDRPGFEKAMKDHLSDLVLRDAL